MSPLLFAPRESRELGLAIAGAANLELAPLEERQFAGGEFTLRPLCPVRDHDVAVVQSLAGTDATPIAERLLRLLFLLGTLRDAGARRRIAVIPYLAYARQDRRGAPFEPVHTRYVAELLEAAGMTHLVALDVHDAAALDNAFRVPVDHLSARELFAEWCAGRLDGGEVTVASPDFGGIKRAQLFRAALERRLARRVGLAFVEKQRSAAGVSDGLIAGPVEGRDVLLIDDLCATGATLEHATRAFRAAGATSMRILVSHVPQADGLRAIRALHEVREIATTSSVPGVEAAGASAQGPGLVVLDVAALLAGALTLPGVPS